MLRLGRGNAPPFQSSCSLLRSWGCSGERSGRRNAMDGSDTRLWRATGLVPTSLAGFTQSSTPTGSTETQFALALRHLRRLDQLPIRLDAIGIDDAVGLVSH